MDGKGGWTPKTQEERRSSGAGVKQEEDVGLDLLQENGGGRDISEGDNDGDAEHRSYKFRDGGGGCKVQRPGVEKGSQEEGETCTEGI